MAPTVTRRRFLKSAGGVVVALFVVGDPLAQGSTREKLYAYSIDPSKCIGCGSCTRACAKENQVPEGKHRTWIERYSVTASGGTCGSIPDTCASRSSLGLAALPEAGAAVSGGLCGGLCGGDCAARERASSSIVTSPPPSTSASP